MVSFICPFFAGYKVAPVLCRSRQRAATARARRREIETKQGKTERFLQKDAKDTKKEGIIRHGNPDRNGARKQGREILATELGG